MALAQKACLTPKDQVDFLNKRGVIFSDKHAAERILRHIGIAHLKSYWLNTSTRDFSEIIQIYNFDTRLKLLFIEALARIEISVRNSWIRCLANPDKNYTPLHYCDTNIYANSAKIITEFEDSRDNTDRDFVQKYKNNGTMPPIWKMAEIISFGCLSRAVRALKDKSGIAKCYYLEQRDFTTILHRLVNIRNICAHHDSLWNQEEAGLNPKLSKSNKAAILINSINTASAGQKRLYNSLCFCAFLLRAIYPANEYAAWRKQAKAIFTAAPPAVSLAAIGFPPDWGSRPLW